MFAGAYSVCCIRASFVLHVFFYVPGGSAGGIVRTNEHVSYGLKIRVSYIMDNADFKPRSPGSFCMDSGGPPQGDVLRRTLVPTVCTQIS
jgi:hypothetical protein